MSEYTIRTLSPGDGRGRRQLDDFLRRQGIRRDAHLDYTCVMTDEGGRWVATGSCFDNTLRCIAVEASLQGEGLLAALVTHLLNVQVSRGHTHVFLHTRPDAAARFAVLGFHEIARAPGGAVFMENRRDGFAAYLRALPHAPGAGAAVLNANPFTRGHLHLIEAAVRACGALHVFVVSEDRSLVPFAVRKRLVIEGTAHCGGVSVLETGPYLISSATFPGYFLRDGDSAVQEQARLDARVFLRIAQAAGIARRFVGEEPDSGTTRLYNRVLAQELPPGGVALTVLPRLAHAGRPVSASDVRALIRAGDLQAVRSLVPDSTWRYLNSPEAQPVLARIRNAPCVRHG